MSLLRVAFVSREVALAPLCVGGLGDVARALARWVLRDDGPRLSELRGVAANDVLLLMGAAETLPWVDGVFYLGKDPHAPRLLLPTQLRPDVPLAAFEQAIVRHVGELESPIAVLAHPCKLIPLAEARPVNRERLAAWLKGAS